MDNTMAIVGGSAEFEALGKRIVRSAIDLLRAQRADWTSDETLVALVEDHRTWVRLVETSELVKCPPWTMFPELVTTEQRTGVERMLRSVSVSGERKVLLMNVAHGQCAWGYWYLSSGGEA